MLVAHSIGETTSGCYISRYQSYPLFALFETAGRSQREKERTRRNKEHEQENSCGVESRRPFRHPFALHLFCCFPLFARSMSDQYYRSPWLWNQDHEHLRLFCYFLVAWAVAAAVAVVYSACCSYPLYRRDIWRALCGGPPRHFSGAPLSGRDFMRPLSHRQLAD